LGCKFVSHGTGHPICNGSVGHGFDKQVDIGRGRAGNANHRIYHGFRDNFTRPKALENSCDISKFLFRHKLVCAEGAHGFAHQGRRVGHCAHQLDLLTEHFFNGADGLPCGDGYHKGARLQAVFYLGNDIWE
jgi:hypothetical protein